MACLLCARAVTCTLGFQPFSKPPAAASLHLGVPSSTRLQNLACHLAGRFLKCNFRFSPQQMPEVNNSAWEAMIPGSFGKHPHLPDPLLQLLKQNHRQQKHITDHLSHICPPHWTCTLLYPEVTGSTMGTTTQFPPNNAKVNHLSQLWAVLFPRGLFHRRIGHTENQATSNSAKILSITFWT